jgi:putative protein kinase ArgK-like GTPase of G3E family
VREEIVRLIEREISKYVHKMLKYEVNFEDVIDQVVARKQDPYSYARKVTEPFAQYYQIYKIDKSKPPG